MTKAGLAPGGANNAAANAVETDAELVMQLFAARDALDNISATRAKLQLEKSVIDSQLHVQVKAQVQLLSQGVASLATARKNIGGAGRAIGEIQMLHAESADAVVGFDKIQELSKVLANFDQTQKFVDHFKTFHRDIEFVRALMAQDGEFRIQAPMENLIPIHFALNKLREVEGEAKFHLQGSDVTADVRATVRKHFEPLDDLVKEFDGVLFDIAGCLLEVLREGDRSLVVRTAKVIDFEEKKDFLASYSGPTGSSLNTTAGAGAADGRSESSQKYLSRFFDSIKQSIHETFDACMDHYGPEEGASEMLDVDSGNLDWIYNDLLAARELLAPCVPKRWGIFEKYVEYYHQETHRLLETIMRFEPPASTLLMLLHYVKVYYATMKERLGLTRAQLKPPLLDGREKEIYDEYLLMLVNKLKEWYATIAVEEREMFKTRSNPPETHHDNVLGLEGHTTLAKLVSQQLDVAADSGQGRVVANCVDSCCDILLKRQGDWMELVRSEVRAETRAADGAEGAAPVPPGLFEYLIALANDQDRAYNFLEELREKWTHSLPRKYKEQVNSRLDETQQGYQEVTKVCLLGILALIFDDMHNAFEQIFVDIKWYRGATTQAIVDTLADFASEAQAAMLDDLFELFMFKLCGETVLHYLKAMRHARLKLSMPAGKQRILDDVKQLFDFFTREEYRLNPEDVEPFFEVFAPMCDTLDAPVEELTEPFIELRHKIWDAPLDLYECMVALRKDLDVKTFKSVMARARQVVVADQENQSKEEAVEHTFLHEFRR